MRRLGCPQGRRGLAPAGLWLTASVAAMCLGCADPATLTAVEPGVLETGPDAPPAEAAGRLAATRLQLDALADGEASTGDEVDRVVALLDEMDAQLGALEDAGGEPPGEWVARHRGVYREDIRAAREDALADPPSLDRARSVRRDCLRCHDRD